MSPLSITCPPPPLSAFTRQASFTHLNHPLKRRSTTLQLTVGDLGISGACALTSRHGAPARRADRICLQADRNLDFVRVVHGIAVDLIVEAVVLGRSSAGSLGVLVTGGAGGGAHCTRRLIRDIIARQPGGVLAREREQLIAVRALRYFDAVLVGPGLDLGVRPRGKQLVGEGLLC